MTTEFRESPDNLRVLAEARVMQLLDAFKLTGLPTTPENMQNLAHSLYAQGFVDGSGAGSVAEMEKKVDAYTKRCDEFWKNRQ